MGYTHYWKLNPNGNELNYQKGLAMVREIIANSPVRLGDGSGDEPITKEDFNTYISINGLGNDAHETFSLPSKLKEVAESSYKKPDNEGYIFDFCKTQHKPYDPIVTACLTVMKFCLRNDMTVSSDGGEEGFEEGMALATKILGRSFPNPSYEVENSVEFIIEEK
jgi:hypothetical protein